MFGRRKEPGKAARSHVPEVITEPAPMTIPPMVMWRIEQTDGRRTIEAHSYEKGDRYVTFYRWTGGFWKHRNWYRPTGEPALWRWTWIKEVVCELNHDYIMTIEESI